MKTTSIKFCTCKVYIIFEKNESFRNEKTTRKKHKTFGILKEVEKNKNTLKFVFLTVRKLKKKQRKEKQKFFVPERRNTNKYCKINMIYKLVKILVRNIGFSYRKSTSIKFLY